MEANGFTSCSRAKPLLLSTAAGGSVGMVTGGECLGEMALLTATPHSATATARTLVETAVLDRRSLAELIRLRPDIGVLIYKNLATGLGEKLKRADLSGSRIRRRSQRAKNFRRRDRQ